MAEDALITAIRKAWSEDIGDLNHATAEIARLQSELAAAREEIGRLRKALRSAIDRARELSMAGDKECLQEEAALEPPREDAP